jgi:hypothetical protein
LAQQKLAGLDDDHPPATPCHLEEVHTIKKTCAQLKQSSVMTVYISQVFVHFCGSVQFKVKFNQGTLFPVENFDT